MGMFDNLINDIVSGKLDKKLDAFAGQVEKLSGKLDGSVEKLSDQHENVAKGVEKVTAEMKKTIKVVRADDNEVAA